MLELYLKILVSLFGLIVWSFEILIFEVNLL